jgi:hypothetical protein
MSAAYEQSIPRAHSQDILVYGATLLPVAGANHSTCREQPTASGSTASSVLAALTQ